jgi:transposase
MDIGDRFSQLTIRGADGEVLERRRIGTTHEAIHETFATEAGTRVAYEVGTHSPWITWLLASLGCETIVANARQLHLITKSDKKTDRRDADLLSELAYVRPQLLAPIEHQSAEAHGHRAVISARAALVASRTALINTVRGLTKSMGVRLMSARAEYFHERVRGSVPEVLRASIDPILDVIGETTARIQAFDDLIEHIGETKHPVTTVLRRIKGVGPITSLAFVLRIEDPSRFKRSRDVGAYLGLVPKLRQSGNSDPQLRITKAGDPTLRALLVQCAHYIMGPFGADCDLRRFGERLLRRGKQRAKKQAVIAVARKLAVLLHRLWITGEVYDPLHNANRAQAHAA